MSDLADRLEVKIIAARDLIEAEGGECNPFAVVRCNMVRGRGHNYYLHSQRIMTGAGTDYGQRLHCMLVRMCY